MPSDPDRGDPRPAPSAGGSPARAAVGAGSDAASVYNPAVSARATLLVGLAFLTFFVGLGRPAITDSDEAFYAQAGREMVETGDWVTPRYNGEYRFEKPVLFYWLVALAYLPAGAGEFAARLPSALAGLGLVLVAFACARRWYDDDTAILAGAVTATSFAYVGWARQALPDLALACFITAAIWAAFEALVVPRTACGRRRGWLAAAGAALAAGFLTKGPVGVVLPALAVGPAAVWRCLSEGRSAGGPGRPLARLAADVGLLAVICLILTLPWFAAMTATHGPAYLERFFIDENMERFATDRYNDPRPFWYYLPIVIGGLLPWSPLMVVFWRPVRAVLAGVRRVGAAEVRLVLWALAPLLFYSLSIGKQPRYVLPVLLPLAILLARGLSRAPARQAAPVPGATGSWRPGEPPRGCLLLLFGVAVARAGVLFGDGSLAAVRIASVLIVLSGAGVALAALASRPRLLPAALTASAVVTALSLQYSSSPPGAGAGRAHGGPSPRGGRRRRAVRPLPGLRPQSALLRRTAARGSVHAGTAPRVPRPARAGPLRAARRRPRAGPRGRRAGVRARARRLSRHRRPPASHRPLAGSRDPPADRGARDQPGAAVKPRPVPCGGRGDRPAAGAALGRGGCRFRRTRQTGRADSRSGDNRNHASHRTAPRRRTVNAEAPPAGSRLGQTTRESVMRAFSARRASTSSGTRPRIDPPRANTSLTSRELRYV